MTLKSKLYWTFFSISLLVCAAWMTYRASETSPFPVSGWFFGVGIFFLVFGIASAIIAIIGFLNPTTETPAKVFLRLYLDDDIPVEEYKALMFQIKRGILSKLTTHEKGFLTSGKYNKFREMHDYV